MTTATVQGALRIAPADQPAAAAAMSAALAARAPHIHHRLTRNRTDQSGNPTFAGILNVTLPDTGWAGGGCGDDIRADGHVEVYFGDLAPGLDVDTLVEALDAAAPYLAAGGHLTFGDGRTTHTRRWTPAHADADALECV